MKNKLGIFTALILSLVIAGSAFALPNTASVRSGAVSKAKVTKTKKTKKHRRHKRKAVKKAVKKTTTTKTSQTPTKKQ